MKRIARLIKSFIFHNPTDTVIRSGFFTETVWTGPVTFKPVTAIKLTKDMVMGYAWRIAKAAASFWSDRIVDTVVSAKEFIDSALSQAWERYHEQNLVTA